MSGDDTKTVVLKKAINERADGAKAVGETDANCLKKKPCESSCPKELTKKEYDWLRGGNRTPSPERQKQANMKIPHECDVCKKPVATLEADHIVPLKIINQMPGFACLSPEDQIDVANLESNFARLCRSCNGSKGGRDWYRWREIKKSGWKIPGEVRDRFLPRRNEQVKYLKEEIRRKDCKKALRA